MTTKIRINIYKMKLSVLLQLEVQEHASPPFSAPIFREDSVKRDPH